MYSIKEVLDSCELVRHLHKKPSEGRSRCTVRNTKENDVNE